MQRFSQNHKEFAQLRNCCAIVSIRYLSDDVTKHKASPRYVPIEFAFYVGGILSLWYGANVLSFDDYLFSMLSWIKRELMENERKSAKGWGATRQLRRRIWSSMAPLSPYYTQTATVGRPKVVNLMKLHHDFTDQPWRSRLFGHPEGSEPSTYVEPSEDIVQRYPPPSQSYSMRPRARPR